MTYTPSQTLRKVFEGSKGTLGVNIEGKPMKRVEHWRSLKVYLLTEIEDGC